jgi:hypothetical protein
MCKKRTITIQTIVFAIIHLAILATCFSISFSLGMERFDTGVVEESTSESIANLITMLLSLPGHLLWTSWASKNLPNIFEWALVIINSLLWGYCLGAIFRCIKNKKHITKQSS